MSMVKILIILFSIFFIINTVLFFITNSSTNNSDVNLSSTVFIIREFDFPSEWRNSEIKYAEVTREELNQYSILKKKINGEDCTKYDKNLWRCKINPDEWNRTKNFINNKEDTDTCIKIGENCYSIDFVICCTNNIDIESIIVCCGDEEIYLEENDTNSMIIVTIQNNQSLSTDMLTLSINIKNSSNNTVSSLDSDTKFYIKDNSSLSSFATMNIPGPGEYEIEVKIFEDEEIIAQRSVAIDVKGIMTEDIMI